MTNITREKSQLFSLEKVLSQVHPMILLDEIIDYGNEFAVALIRPEAGKPFADDNGCIPAWIGIEYMAQTIGVYAGIQSQIAGKAVKIGFLLGTRAYDFSLDKFYCAQSYWVRAEKIYDGDGLCSFECTIYQPKDRGNNDVNIEKNHQNKNNIARAIISTFQPNDIEVLLPVQVAELARQLLCALHWKITILLFIAKKVLGWQKAHYLRFVMPVATDVF